jgi:hypothetical protein
MIRFVRAGLAVAIGSAMGLLTGCGSSSGNASFEERGELSRANSLGEIGQMLRVREADARRPAATLADLAKYEPGFPSGFRMASSGDAILMLGAPVEDGATENVLAFEKQAPESGGYVLMQDGTTVKKMSADEFRAAPSAPGTPTSGKEWRPGRASSPPRPR